MLNQQQYAMVCMIRWLWALHLAHAATASCVVLRLLFGSAVLRLAKIKAILLAAPVPLPMVIAIQQQF
jgi:hypothetical protein